MAGKYKQTRVQKPTNKKPKKKTAPANRLSKTQLDDRLHMSRFASIGLLILASFALLTSVSIVLTGGWDSTVLILLALAPLFALIAFGLTWRIRTKYRRRARDYRLSLVALVFFCAVFYMTTGYLSVLSIKKYYDLDHRPEIVGDYNCADSANSRELGIYTTRFMLATKHYQIEDFRSNGVVYGSYEATRDGDKYMIKTLIKENTEKEKTLNFNETSYELELESDLDMRLTLSGSGAVRYCRRQ